MKREDAMQFSGGSQLLPVSIGVVEIMAVLDQLGTERAHRRILLFWKFPFGRHWFASRTLGSGPSSSFVSLAQTHGANRGRPITHAVGRRWHPSFRVARFVLNPAAVGLDLATS